MEEVWQTIRGLGDQLNPMSPQNVAIFFTWLVIYLFTAMAIWRAERRWLRLVCFLVNQLFSVGIVISAVYVIVPAINLWGESLVVAGLTIGLSVWLFRRRRPIAEAEGPGVPQRESEAPVLAAPGRPLLEEGGGAQPVGLAPPGTGAGTPAVPPVPEIVSQAHTALAERPVVQPVDGGGAAPLPPQQGGIAPAAAGAGPAGVSEAPTVRREGPVVQPAADAPTRKPPPAEPAAPEPAKNGEKGDKVSESPDLWSPPELPELGEDEGSR